jgi:uroporphyrinogen-III synthase
MPLIEIAPPPEPALLAAILPRLPGCQWAVFVSPSAVRMGLAAVREHLEVFPEAVRLAAVGEGSAKPLREALGRPVLIPFEAADSEGLLACPDLQALAGQHVMLFRGLGGRTLIADTLTARGATVLHAVCYERRRLMPEAASLLASRTDSGPAAISVTSTEILDQLVQVLGDSGSAWLQTTPLFVPHPRIAAAAQAYGVRDVRLIEPGDAGLIAALSGPSPEN